MGHLLACLPRLFLLAALAAAMAASAAAPFNPKPWLEDYQQLRAHMAVAYANLDDLVASGQVDPVKLDRETTAALKRSRSELEAVRALLTFVGAFQDGHLRVVPGNHPLFQTGPRYDVRFAVDAERVVLLAPLPAPCALRPGDSVERVNGRPVAAWLAELERLVGIRNPELRRNLALMLLTRGPLAPPQGLMLEGRSTEGDTRSCRLEPATPPPSPPASAPPAPAAPPVTFAMAGEAACEAMRFKARPVEAPYVGPEVPGFERLVDPANAFPAGLLTLAPGRTLGVVRIPLFSDEVYPATCAAVWDAYRVGREGPCDEHCQGTFRHEQVVTRLLADLAARVRRFQEAKVEGVVVDLTGNGGGTNWVDPAARIFGPKGMANLGSGFIRHPHWVKNLEAMVADMDSDLARPELPEADRRIVTEARERLARQAAEARAACPRDALWTKPGVTKTCPGVVRAAGAPYLPQEALQDVGSRRLLSHALGYRFEEALYTGPLVLLVDARTASASEYAVSMLKDSAGARLVGSRTNGSGCGYTNGGVPVVLKHSGLRVVMPDCVRYRKDGTNEVEGFVPDLPVPWSPTDSPEARARKWMDVLRAGLTPP
jgi:hypothetical protein